MMNLFLKFFYKFNKKREIMQKLDVVSICILVQTDYCVSVTFYP